MHRLGPGPLPRCRPGLLQHRFCTQSDRSGVHPNVTFDLDDDTRINGDSITGCGTKADVNRVAHDHTDSSTGCRSRTAVHTDSHARVTSYGYTHGHIDAASRSYTYALARIYCNPDTVASDYHEGRAQCAGLYERVRERGEPVLNSVSTQVVKVVAAARHRLRRVFC